MSIELEGQLECGYFFSWPCG